MHVNRCGINSFVLTMASYSITVLIYNIKKINSYIDRHLISFQCFTIPKWLLFLYMSLYSYIPALFYLEGAHLWKTFPNVLCPLAAIFVQYRMGSPGRRLKGRSKAPSPHLLCFWLGLQECFMSPTIPAPFVQSLSWLQLSPMAPFLFTDFPSGSLRPWEYHLFILFFPT